MVNIMTFQIRKLGIASAFSLLTVFSSFNAYAGPGVLPKIPLFDTNQPVEPNIFYTIDDSGSMDWELMFSQGASKFPSDQGLPIIGGSRLAYFVPSWNGSLIPSLAGDPDSWMFRISDANTLYYDTNINYEFWPGKDLSGNDLYKDALKGAVREHPDNSANTINIENTNGGRYLPTFCTWDSDPNNNGIDETDPHTCIEIKSTTAISNYAQGRTYAEEIQNFANWLQYYRKREYSAKFAIGTVINSTDAARMGLRLINSGHKKDLLSMTNAANKSNLLTTYYADNASGGTPLRDNLRKVGDMFKGPGAILPASQGGECQQNFNVLMTDGFWNGVDPLGVTNADGDGDTQFDGKTAEGNYGDTYSSTLADVAMHYYEKDLRTDLANKVPTKTGIDQADHQHLVNYTIGFGLAGTLDPTIDPNDPNISFAWPKIVRDDPTTLDDLWHAAYNSRGLYLGANNSEDLLNALITAVIDITDRADTAAAAAVTSAQLTTDTIVYLARYNTVDWSGDVLAHKIRTDANGEVLPTGELELTPLWSAADLLGNRTTARDIITYDKSVGAGGIPFKWNTASTLLTTPMKDDLKTTCVNTTATTSSTTTPSGNCFNQLNKTYCEVTRTYYKNTCPDKLRTGPKGNRVYWCYTPSAVTTTTTTSASCSVDTDAVAQKRVSFIRGEMTNAEAITNNFRERTTIKTANGSVLSLIGDVVNSGPVFVGAPNLDIPDTAPFPTGANGYSKYKLAQKNRTGVVYAGSNDGLFHAFRAQDTNGQPGGEELLAYIPSYLFSTDPQAGLHYLTQKTYSHMFYNDLTATVADVNISGSAWSTVLLGGQRAGGRGYFALDVTNPGSFSEANAATIALWEFSSSDDPDLGYTYSRPQIGMLNDGTWVAIFGNGYNQTGADGMAKLFILKLAGPGADKVWDLGTDYIKISTGSAKPVSPNGLATPALADIDLNGTIDRAYAGDLNGDLWVFDLSGSFGSGTTLANTTPLFTTTGNLPITTQPNLSFHPSQPTVPANEPNVMVFFGSGQFLVLGDKVTSNSDHFYGVWDKSGAGSHTGLTQANLVTQAFDTPTSRILTDNPVDYNGSAYGWAIALPDKGERSITNAAVRGDIVFFNTSVPTNEPCSTNGYGYTLAVDLATGSSPQEPILDRNDDGVIDDKDTVGPNNKVPAALLMDSFPTDNTFTDKVKFTGKDPLAISQLTQPRLGRFSWQELLK